MKIVRRELSLSPSPMSSPLSPLLSLPSSLSSLLLPSFLVAVPLAVPDVPSPPVVVLLLHQSAPVLALFPLPRLKTASSRGDENLGGRAPGKIMLKEALYNP